MIYLLLGQVFRSLSNSCFRSIYGAVMCAKTGVDLSNVTSAQWYANEILQSQKEQALRLDL